MILLQDHILPQSLSLYSAFPKTRGLGKYFHITLTVFVIPPLTKYMPQLSPRCARARNCVHTAGSDGLKKDPEPGDRVTVAVHPAGPQESQEASGGSRIQRVLHVRTDSDPGVQGSRFHFTAECSDFCEMWWK